MVEEGLKIKFIGEDGNLAKTLGDLTSQLKRFQDGLKNATNTESFSRIQRAIDATKQRIDLLNNVNQFQNFKKGTNEATQSLVNLSRVAQDAPYGFLGIANNINPLLESFQRLQKETGSTKGALSALGSSLMGAGGLGLAVGVVSSLLVVFGDDLFSAKSSADDLSTALEDVGKASDIASEGIGKLQDLLSLMSTLSDINIEIGGGNQSEVLKQQLKNTQEIGDKISKTLEAQNERNLYTELNYFNLSDKQKKDADKQIEQHNDKILEMGEQLSKNLSDQAVLKLKIQLQEQKESEEASKKAEAQRKKTLEKEERDRAESLQKLRDWQNERSRIIGEMSKDFSGIRIFSLPDVGDPQSNTELFDRLRKRLKEEADRQPPLKIKLPVEIAVDQDFKTGKINITEKIKEFDVDIKKLPPLKMPVDIELHLKKIENIDKIKSDFQKSVNESFKQFEVNAFAGIGEAIGQSLASGGNIFENAARSFSDSLGGFIETLGKQIIQLGVVKTGIDAVINSLWELPGAAIIATGVATVALGALVRQLGNQKPKGFALGGVVTGPTLGLVGEGKGTSYANPEIVAPLDKLKNYIGDNSQKMIMPDGKWRIRGRDLVYVVTQEQKSQRRGG